MKMQWRNVSDEQEQDRVRRAPVARCECCGVAVHPRCPWFTALYTLLCRACWLIETSACQDEVMYDEV